MLTPALAFALDVLVILVFAALRFFDKIDNDVLFLVIGPIVGAMAAKRAPKPDGTGGSANGAVASLVAGLAGLALVGGRRMATVTAMAMVLLSGCLPFLSGDAEDAVAVMKAECRKSPEQCEQVIDTVAEGVCPSTDSVRACLRGYVGEP